jgi:hypothetical protein
MCCIYLINKTVQNDHDKKCEPKIQTNEYYIECFRQSKFARDRVELFSKVGYENDGKPKDDWYDPCKKDHCYDFVAGAPLAVFGWYFNGAKAVDGD